MTASRLLIRKAEPLDAAAACSLFAVRSENEEAADATDPDLENPRRKVWLAFDNARAVGMTSLQQRRLQVRNDEHSVAYWTGLFVDPAYRSAFVYPQLVLAMFAGLREQGIKYLYGATRRAHLAVAHQKIGLRKVGDMTVLAKPLRPALLLAKYRNLVGAGAAQRLIPALCAVPDAVIRMAVRLQGPWVRTPWQVREIPWCSNELNEVARLYARRDCGYTAQLWTAETLRARYERKDAGYRMLGVWHHEHLLAAAIIRVADRAGIRTAVIMDLIHQPTETRAANIALSAAERVALASNCDVVLFLDGLAQSDGRLVRRRGYLRSPEKYCLLVWTDRGSDPAFFPKDIRCWRFAFGDHDTF
jgi:hypothetical protein